MFYFYLILVFLFGAALGSFILVIADRHNTGLPFFKGRSICFSCSAQLQNKDLVPIFSFILLKGKCRYCHSKIPKEALIVEILMGILSILAAFKSGLLVFDPSFNFSWLLAAGYLLLTSIFAIILLISIYDLKHFIIPDSFVFAFFVFAFIYNFLFAAHNFSFIFLLQHFASGAILAVPFLFIFLISRGAWFGFGDVKYILVIGFLLGLVQGLSAIILAFWIGAAFSILILLAKRLKISLPIIGNNFTIKSEVPFGPFLSLGVLAGLLVGMDLFQIHNLLNVF